MSILHRIPRAELESQFTHYGWFLGLVPVYVASPDSDGPTLVERNWVPELWFTFVETLFGLFCLSCELLDPAFEPAYPIFITGAIERGDN